MKSITASVVGALAGAILTALLMFYGFGADIRALQSQVGELQKDVRELRSAVLTRHPAGG